MNELWVSSIVVSIVVLFLLRRLLNLIWQLKHFPPGPWGLPVVGYLPWVDQHAYLTFTKLKKRYGNVFSITLGGETAVVLADWNAIKATLVDKAQIFSGRPKHHTFDTATKRRTVSFNHGKVWKNQRSLITKCLRQVGVGRSDTEGVVAEAVGQVVKLFDSFDGQIIPMSDVFFKPIFSAIWKMVTGHGLRDSSKEDVEFEHMIVKMMAGIRVNNPLNFMPWLRFVPPNGFGFWKFLSTTNEIWKRSEAEIHKHLDKWREGQEADIIDHYITAIKKHENQPHSQPEKHLTYEHLGGSLWDFFMAGGDTTSTTAVWGVLYLILFPEVQRKARDEVDRVIGNERMPSLDDFQTGRLPYVDAVLMETHRMSSIVPLSLTHCPMETTTVFGYTIPKDTPCIQNIYGCHYDPELWEDPQNFRPERFIHEGQVKWPPYLMPYSIGPRLCIGVNLAQQELRLIFATLLQRYILSVPPGQPMPTTNREISLVVRPSPFSTLVRRRKQVVQNVDNDSN